MLSYTTWPKSFLVRILNEITEQELNELARDVSKNDLVDISLFLRGGFNLASISEVAETWLRMAQMPHRFEVGPFHNATNPTPRYNLLFSSLLVQSLKAVIRNVMK
jgi:hypothetical protein